MKTFGKELVSLFAILAAMAVHRVTSTLNFSV